MNIFELINEIKEAMPDECTEVSVSIKKDCFVFKAFWIKNDKEYMTMNKYSFIQVSKSNFNPVWFVDAFVRRVHNAVKGEKE